MSDLVQKLVGALENFTEGCSTSIDAYAVARAALSAAKAGGWVAVQGKPVAWMRKWAYEGEVPQKIRNENGRMAWPAKFKFLPVTQGKCISDDVPLYAPLPAPPAQKDNT